MKKLSIFTAIALFVFLSTTFSTSAQIVNGSFEEGPEPGSFLQAYTGTGITGWTIDVENIDYIGSYWQASNGNRSIDLNGYYAASKISQLVPTVPGITYQVSFDMSGNPDGSPAVKTMTVTANDGYAQDYEYEVTAENSHDNMRWEATNYYFVATSTTTKLSFATTIPGAFGPALDNVSITNITAKICHRNNSPGVKTLTVGVSAIPAHLAHGDTLGPCAAQ